MNDLITAYNSASEMGILQVIGFALFLVIVFTGIRLVNKYVFNGNGDSKPAVEQPSCIEQPVIVDLENKHAAEFHVMQEQLSENKRLINEIHKDLIALKGKIDKLDSVISITNNMITNGRR